MNRSRELVAALRRLGWLPLGQIVTLVCSLVSFALLSRLLGPGIYAQFAVLVFVFTICALATDFSAQGYLLVHGTSERVFRQSQRSAAVSAALGSILLLLVLVLVSLFPIPLGPPSIVEIALLIAALALQAAVQPYRGFLLSNRRYGLIALADVAAAVAGYGGAVVGAILIHTPVILCAQLALTAAVRWLVSVSAARGRVRFADERAELPAKSPFAYGLRVLPVNVASYASRSIDSGILPFILPAGAAASYARAYQLIVTPITQVQLSIGGAMVERLAKAVAAGGAQGPDFPRRLWRALSASTFAAAVALSLASPLIKTVFFSDGWTNVRPSIIAMACLLPSMTLSAYLSWRLQVSGTIRQSLLNLGILLVIPFLAIALAAAYGAEGALYGLVFGALIQAIALAVTHAELLPETLGRVLVQVIGEWVVLFAMFWWFAAG